MSLPHRQCHGSANSWCEESVNAEQTVSKSKTQLSGRGVAGGHVTLIVY